MNSWRARCLAGASILLAMYGHAWATGHLPNTPEGMLMFHGSAALLDLLLLYAAPALLHGRLCADAQRLLLASIVGNFAGWLLYVAYVSPTFYNCFMWVLTYAQLLRLFIPDRHADLPWLDLVRHRDHFSGSHHP
ncbi:hypothetical protein [Massilia sp. CT11-137]|uniref:hypothetical protein n=1 Tax=Massilia sp. CT11-137 TaxID=3393901 RepID=UPI0039B0D00D